MNTNDFSVCRPGDKLFSLEFGECVVKKVDKDGFVECETLAPEIGRYIAHYYFNGHKRFSPMQLLYFSKPEIFAPERKEPLRLECECVWSLSPGGIMFPFNREVTDDLKQFHCKRTKMILEEIT